MTPTTSEREAQFQAWWRASKYCQVAYGDHEQVARDAWQAALTREQQEGVHGTKDCGIEQSAKAVFVPCDCGCGRQCCAHCGTDLGFVQEKPQQEAQGAQAQQKIIAYQYHSTLTFAEEADDFMRNEGTPLISALDGQPAGVDDAMVERAKAAYDTAEEEWLDVVVEDRTGDSRHGHAMRAALQAALGGGGGRDG